MTTPLPTVPVHAIDPQPDAPQWLVRDLWTAAAVGVVAGSPKVGKSWFGLDLAVSVASGTPALGRFPVHATGPVLVYLAEDALPRVRDRVAHLCRHRGLDLARLDLHVVTADRLRLDTDRDQLALDQTVARIRPALLLLDPLVRLHSLDENSASDISSLLGFLRSLNRRYQLALVLVHHLAKRSRRNLGQSLRGSSDLHAWTDSACYLVRRADDRLQLTVEHRSAPAPDPGPRLRSNDDLWEATRASVKPIGTVDRPAISRTPKSPTFLPYSTVIVTLVSRESHNLGKNKITRMYQKI